MTVTANGSFSSSPVTCDWQGASATTGPISKLKRLQGLEITWCGESWGTEDCILLLHYLNYLLLEIGVHQLEDNMVLDNQCSG
jgi:hypothetical protein